MSKQEQEKKIDEIYKLIEEAKTLINLSKQIKTPDQTIGSIIAKATP